MPSSTALFSRGCVLWATPVPLNPFSSGATPTLATPPPLPFVFFGACRQLCAAPLHAAAYGARIQAGACEPRGNAPADAMCSKTAEDDAKEQGKAVEYTDGVMRVRLPAHAGASVCASACMRKRMRVLGVSREGERGFARARACVCEQCSSESKCTLTSDRIRF
jgi:hypothetical protein